jgi:hypothetical protein
LTLIPIPAKSFTKKSERGGGWVQFIYKCCSLSKGGWSHREIPLCFGVLCDKPLILLPPPHVPCPRQIGVGALHDPFIDRTFESRAALD